MRRKTPSGKDVLSSSQNFKSILNKAQFLRLLSHEISIYLPLELQSQCEVANYREGILVLHVPTSTWNTRLRLATPELQKQLQLQPRFKRLRKIEVKVRPLEQKLETQLPKASLSTYGAEVLREMKQQLEDE